MTKLLDECGCSRHILVDADGGRGDGIAQSYFVEGTVCSVGPSGPFGVV